MYRLDFIRTFPPPNGTEVFVYLHGTNDQAQVFSDFEKTQPVAQPIVLSSSNSYFYCDERVDIKFVHASYTDGFLLIEDAILPLPGAGGQETDPVFSSWDKSSGISITESQISDFGNYEPANANIQEHISSPHAPSNATNGADWNTNVANKPTIPSNLSDLAEDTTHRTVTDTEKSTWNSKSDFSGSYTDLTNKPSLGSAATADTEDFEAAGAVATHEQNNDHNSYLTSFTETDPVFSAWDKSTGISITESQISDFGNYEAANANIQEHIGATGNPHGTTKSDISLGNVANQRQQILHGFENRTGSVISKNSYDFATKYFTLGFSSSYYIFINGVPIQITGSKSVLIGTSYGQHFIWFEGDGELHAGTSVWDIFDTTKIPVATVYYTGTQGKVADERHSAYRNLADHHRSHHAWGSLYISGFSALPTFGAGSANTFSFPGGLISDEDLFNDSTALDELYVTQGSIHNTLELGRKISGQAALEFMPRGTGYAYLNGAIPQYDLNGTLTDIPAASTTYGFTDIFATNRPGCPIVGILGQAVYASVASAQAASIPTLHGMSVAEWKHLYRVIYRRFANALQFIQADVLYNKTSGPVINQGSPSQLPAGNVTVSSYGTNISGNAQNSFQNLEDNKLPASGGTIQNYREKAINVGNFGASYILDLSQASEFHGTLDQSCTFALPNAPDTDLTASFTLVLTQGVGGSKSITAPGVLGTDYVLNNIPSLNTTAGKVTELIFRYNRTKSAWVVYLGAKDA